MGLVVCLLVAVALEARVAWEAGRTHGAGVFGTGGAGARGRSAQTWTAC